VKEGGRGGEFFLWFFIRNNNEIDGLISKFESGETHLH
jgi:hypothetical protein